MAEPHVMDALRGKRSELSGIVSHLEQQIVQHRASLVHLDAAMRLFDPGLAPEATSSQPQRPRSTWFRPGECLRLIHDVLREAPQPMTTRALTEQVMGVKAIVATDERSCALTPEDRSWVAQPCQGHDPARRDRRRGFVADRLDGVRALPVAAEVDRRAASHRQADDAMRLLTVADAAQVLPPCRFLRIADEIGTSDVVVMPQLAAAQAGEVRLCPVGAGAVDAVAVLVVDPLHGEPGVQRVPGRAFVGVHHGAVGDPLAEGRHGGLLAGEHLRQRATIALARHHHDPAFARPAFSPPPVDPVGGPVFWPDMAAEIGAVDLGHPLFAADLQALHAGRHNLPQLVRQHEGRFVLHVELAGKGEHVPCL